MYICIKKRKHTKRGSLAPPFKKKKKAVAERVEKKKKAGLHGRERRVAFNTVWKKKKRGGTLKKRETVEWCVTTKAHQLLLQLSLSLSSPPPLQ